MSPGLGKDARRGAANRAKAEAAPPCGQSRPRQCPAEPPRAEAPPAGGPAPPARHGGGAAVPLGLRGAHHAAAPPAQRVLPGAGGARAPPAAALAQRRHLRRLAGGLRALRAQRGTGPSAARVPPWHRGAPRAGRPRLSPQQLWLAAPGAWGAAGARGKGCVVAKGELCQPVGRWLPPACPGGFLGACVGS